MNKPELLPCPLCGGPMSWCADVPIPGEPAHDCDQLTCTACEYQVDFTSDDVRVCDTLEQARYVVAARWNRRAVLAEVPQPERWQAIETAPKDGTNVLLTNGDSVAQGWWEHQEPYIREKRDMEGHYIDQEEHDGFDGWLDCDGGMQPDPTHWMPLPAPNPTEAPHAA